MKTVLVTGAAGFLGSHLMLHHLRAGDKVLGLDNFCSSKPESIQVDEIKKFPLATLMYCDIADVHGDSRFSRVIHDYDTGSMHSVRFDIIYNFACPASPPIYQRMPVETMMTCTLGVQNVLELAASHGSIVVHASTSEVYGDPESSPQVESYRGRVNSYGPRACYDEGKRAAEALCYDYLHTHGVDARMVRIFNTYGPHMDPYDGRVVSNFIVQALKGEKLTIYGDGQQTRSFCYVDDLIKGIVTLGDLGNNPRMPINLGNPHEFTMNQLAKEVIHQIYGGREAPHRDVARWFDYKPLPVDDPTQRRPDITQAQNRLGWEPKVQLAEGLKRSIDYFRKVIA